MAHSAGDAHEKPFYGYHFRLGFPILDADGDLVSGATGLDSERSLDDGTFADCTNEATEVATNSGMYYLDLTGAEMSAKKVMVIVKTSTTGAKTTPMTLYPERMPVIETGTAQAGAAGTITLASGASAQDDFYNGLYVGITNDSPSGAQYQVRKIIDYAGSTRVATIDSNWGTNPSSSSTYDILLPQAAAVAGWAGKALAAYNTAGVPVVDTTKMNGTALDSFVGTNFNHFFENDGASTIVKVDDVLTAGGAICYSPTTATRGIGDDEGGTVADMAVLDGTVYQTGENATTGLEVTVSVDIGAGLGERLANTNMRVRYSGAGGHSIDVAVYNHDTAAYDTILTLTTSTSLDDYVANLAALADGTGALAAGLAVYKNPATDAVDFRFKHNVETYNASHYLQIDYLCVQTLLVADVPTVSEISAQLDTDGFLKAATPANNELTTAGGEVAATVADKTGYALTAAYDPAKTAAQAGNAMTLTSDYDAAKKNFVPTGITYNGDGTINVVTFNTGTTWTHVYTAGQLTSITVA